MYFDIFELNKVNIIDNFCMKFVNFRVKKDVLYVLLS